MPLGTKDQFYEVKLEGGRWFVRERATGKTIEVHYGFGSAFHAMEAWEKLRDAGLAEPKKIG